MALIYVLEDDESIGTLIQATVKAAGYEAVRFGSADALERALGEALPQLLLLDIMLPDKDGWTVLGEWKERLSTREIPVIVLSAKGAELDKVRGLEAGAEDYVAKPFGVLELQSRVRAALRRRQAEEVFRLGELAVDMRTGEARLRGLPVKLARKESALLVCLCRNAGRAVERERLLREVWGYGFSGETTRTLDFHVQSLRKKLGDSAGDSRYIETLRGFGYRLKKDG